MADFLIEHLREQTDFLESLGSPLPSQENEKRKAFAH